MTPSKTSSIYYQTHNKQYLIKHIETNMKKHSAKENLLFFLQNNQGWFHNGDLQKKEIKNRNGTSATGNTIKRRLQELVTEGKIHVDYRKGGAWYSTEYRPQTKQVVSFEERDGVKVAIVRQVPIEFK